MPAVVRAKPFVVTVGCVWHCCSNRCCCPYTALGPSSRRCNGGGRGRIGGSLSSPTVLVVGVPSSLTAHWGSRTVARSLQNQKWGMQNFKKKRERDIRKKKKHSKVFIRRLSVIVTMTHTITNSLSPQKRWMWKIIWQSVKSLTLPKRQTVKYGNLSRV